MKNNIGAILFVTLVAIILCVSEVYAKQGDQILIGGWGFAETSYAQKNKINYARVVNKPSEQIAQDICSKNFIVTVNLGATSKRGENITREKYLSDLKDWAKISTKYKCIVEIAQDDFRNWWNKDYKKDKNIILSIVDNLKRINPNLMFGATIYDDDFDRLTSEEIRFLSSKIDVIHFYLHNRNSVGKYEYYINKLQTFFPTAKIILGIYRSDRRDYERRIGITPAEELDLFAKQLSYCLKMVKQHKVRGIEFYPGSLGSDSGVIDRGKMQGNEKNTFNIMSKQIDDSLNLLGKK